MRCPVCNKDMIVVEYQDIELDNCLECRGVWFDSGELGLMLKISDAGDISEFIEGMKKSPDAKTREKQRKCPICGKKMSKKNAGDDSGILIDVCPDGDGLWFDGGEVVQFAEQLGKGEDAAGSTENAALNYIKDFFGKS